MESLGWRCYFSDNQGTNRTGEDGKQALLEQVLLKHNATGLMVTPNLQEIRGVDQWHQGIVKHDRNTCKGMKSTSMATNSPTFGVESKGNFVVIQKNMCELTHTQKIICHQLRTK